jgi:hypothetical protein
MPVPSVARQPRGLDAINGADIAGADHRDQPLEARTLDAPRSGAAEIVVDHLHRREARGACGAGQVVLPALAFEISDDLRHGRLPYVNDRRACEVVRRDLGLMTASLPCRCVRRRRPLAHGFEKQIGQRLDQPLHVRGREKRRWIAGFEIQRELRSVSVPPHAHESPPSFLKDAIVNLVSGICRPPPGRWRVHSRLRW